MAGLYVTQGIKTPSKISINPDYCDDPFYRYKMHQILTEITKGKTYLINIDEVSSELKVDPIYMVRYLGSVLGTQATYEKKTHKASLSGTFDVGILSEHVMQFIREVVLCKHCGLPELNYGKTLICRSCGGDDILKNRNIPSTLQKYIIAHH